MEPFTKQPRDWLEAIERHAPFVRAVPLLKQTIGYINHLEDENYKLRLRVAELEGGA